jgi:hypothetical protein
MARWVNEQPTLPLDLRELDTNTGERDGALIEAAAAYSLRKLKEDFTGDVVEVRRNVDGETEGFTADEVTDGTLENFVEGFDLYPARGISQTSQAHFSITKTDDRNFRIVSDLVDDGLSDTKFIAILAPQDGLVLGKQRVTFDVDVNSGDISNFMLRLSYRDDQTNLQPVAGSNSFEIDIVDDGESPNPLIYFAIHRDSSFDVSISNLKIYKSTVNELPLDQATGAAAAYSLRNLSAEGTDLTTVGDTTTDYFSFTGATGDTAALNGIQYNYGFDYNGAKAYNSEPPTPEDSQMVRGSDGRWLLFVASTNTTYALSATGNAQYPWNADWTGTDLESATFSQQRTGKYVVQTRRSSDDAVQSFTASEVADGTLEDWVNTEQVTEESEFTATLGTDGYVASSHGTTTREAEFQGESDVLKYEKDTGRFGFQKSSVSIERESGYRITFDYYADASLNNKFWGVEYSFANRPSAAWFANPSTEGSGYGKQCVRNYCKRSRLHKESYCYSNSCQWTRSDLVRPIRQRQSRSADDSSKSA